MQRSCINRRQIWGMLRLWGNWVVCIIGVEELIKIIIRLRNGMKRRRNMVMSMLCSGSDSCMKMETE